MQLNFLNREQETDRLKRVLSSKSSSLACIYGRRRCGKSRLLREVLPVDRIAYYVADEREAPLQRQALATELARVLPGFDDVNYPDWDALLKRWWRDASSGMGLAIDEFPYLAKKSPELPSLLQKHYDRSQGKVLSLILCGSSQAMMHGLVLDADAPLYGRATEILKISPLKAGWILDGLCIASGPDALLAYTLWGGIPRYWELAAEFESTWSAYEQLVLDPMGVLHLEPERLLHEDIRDPAQSLSMLSLIGQGCHRISEVAGRLEKPATSLVRPLRKLLDLGLIRKDIPFGVNAKSNKQALYMIRDPFLAVWYSHVMPNRSLLERGIVRPVRNRIRSGIHRCQAECWEQLAREATPFLQLRNAEWSPGARWWGTAIDRSKIELDIVAESMDGKRLLVGEAKLSVAAGEVDRLLFELERKAKILPLPNDYELIEPVIFAATSQDNSTPDRVITSDPVLAALR